MMGGVHTDINGATPLPGLYAAGEVACVSINGANRLGSNSLPELLVFGARAGKAAAEYASRAADITPRIVAQTDRRTPAPRARPAAQTRPGDASPSCATLCRRRWRTARVSTDRARRRTRARTSCAELQERYRDIADRGSTAKRSTPSGSRPWSSRSCSTSPKRSSTRRFAAKNRVAPISARISRSGTTSVSSRIRSSTATPTVRPGSSTCRRRSPAGRRPSESMGRPHRMEDHINCR